MQCKKGLGFRVCKQQVALENIPESQSLHLGGG